MTITFVRCFFSIYIHVLKIYIFKFNYPSSDMLSLFRLLRRWQFKWQCQLIYFFLCAYVSYIAWIQFIILFIKAQMCWKGQTNYNLQQCSKICFEIFLWYFLIVLWISIKLGKFMLERNMTWNYHLFL